MTLHELNCKYYTFFEVLYSANSGGKLPEKQFKIMSNVLMQQYEQEVEDYLNERELAFATQRFELKFKVQAYTPRRAFLWWWNPVARKLLKQYKAELRTYLKSLEKSTREEKQYADQLKTSPSPEQQTALVPAQENSITQG